MGKNGIAEREWECFLDMMIMHLTVTDLIRIGTLRARYSASV